MEEVPVTKKMYGWDKYGGARHGLVDNNTPKWHCQICGEEQTRELPKYFIPEDRHQREFFKVCSKCRKAQIVYQTFDFYELQSVYKVVRFTVVGTYPSLANLVGKADTMEI